MSKVNYLFEHLDIARQTLAHHLYHVPSTSGHFASDLTKPHEVVMQVLHWFSFINLFELGKVLENKKYLYFGQNKKTQLHKNYQLQYKYMKMCN